MRPVFLFWLLFLGILQPVYGQDSSLVMLGLPDLPDSIPAPDLGKYRSRTDFPAFVSWEGQGILLNGGSVLYKMNRPDGAISEKYKFARAFEEALSPDRKYFLILDDENGDENYQLSLYDIKNNTATAITGRGTRSSNPFWRRDSKQIIYKNNRRNSAEADLYIRNAAPPYDDRLLLKNVSDEAVIYDWDTRHNRILFAKIISENNKELFLYDIDSGNLQQINSGKHDIAYAHALFIPGSDSILLVSDESSEFLTLSLYALKNGTSKGLTTAIRHDIDEISLNKKGDLLAFTVNEQGSSRLYRMSLKDYTYEPAIMQGPAIIRDLKLNADGNQAAFNVYGSTFNRKVCSYDFATGRLSQWINKQASPKTEPGFVAAVDIRIPAYDSMKGRPYDIPAFIYRPRTPGPHPVYVDIHGGPEYQALATFNRWYQYLVQELHIAVVVPNIRGSNGYGKSFMKADDTRLREQATGDIGVLLDWIAHTPDLDKNKVALFGESYGGYVVLSALTRFPDKIRCGIDVVGISNFVTYLEHTADYRKDLRRAEFGDERDPVTRDFLLRISPVNHADKIKSPLLIVQGYNDPRVHYKESEKIWAAVQNRRGIAWYLGAKDEGHGFRKPEHIALQRKLELLFLKTYLLP